jgi:hypothetical protein
MRKLKLRLEDLRIEGFQTTPVQKEKGTVVGQQESFEASCDGGMTCDYTCEGFATRGGPLQPCVMCGPYSSVC